MKKFLREPLLHFVVLGAAIFVAYGLVSGPGSGQPGRIVVTQGQIENLAAGFAKARQRPPSADELAGLIRERVREEVYFREAMALGLDRDDTIIRRRLSQKMEFVTSDVAAMAEPTDADLDAHLQAHPEAFRIEPRLTFRHVFLNPEKRGGHLDRDAAQLLEQLNEAGSKGDAAELGDPFLLAHEFDAAARSEILQQFGESFTTKLETLEPGRWHGPVESGYGVHLVLVGERTQARMPALAEVRDAVRRDWDNARRLEANENFYQELLGRYAVTIEQPRPAAEAGVLAKVP